jgi:hypothetical protein
MSSQYPIPSPVVSPNPLPQTGEGIGKGSGAAVAIHPATNPASQSSAAAARAFRFFTFRRESCDDGARYRFEVAAGDRFEWLRSVQPVARLGASLSLYHLSAPP